MTRNQTLARNRRSRRWRQEIASAQKGASRFFRKRGLAHAHAERFHGWDPHAIRKSWRNSATPEDAQAVLPDLRTLMAECMKNDTEPQYVIVPAWPCRNCPHLTQAPA